MGMSVNTVSYQRIFRGNALRLLLLMEVMQSIFFLTHTLQFHTYIIAEGNDFEALVKNFRNGKNVVKRLG